MIDYLYDGTFFGLLSCVYEHYYIEKCHGIYEQSAYIPTLIENGIFVTTDSTKAKKVYNALVEKISKGFLNNVYYLFLSAYDNKGPLLISYIALGFKLGKKVDSYHSHKIVLSAHKESRKVSLEVQRFLGLIRFSEIADTLYSAIEPDHDILELLANHFIDRFSTEKFIIHDKKRNKALVASNYEWYITDFKLDAPLNLSESEQFLATSGKSYHYHVGIKERANPKVQSQYMPRRYWKNLTEFSD